jgi:ketosteroid isomerase-like protein
MMTSIAGLVSASKGVLWAFRFSCNSALGCILAQSSRLESKLVIFWTAAALFLSASSPDTVIPGDLTRAVRQYDEAQVHGDKAALSRLLADDYLLINSRGLHENKGQLIADYTAPGFTLKPFIVEDAVAKILPGSAIMSGVATLEGTDSGQPYKVRLRFTDIWAKRHGRWQVVYTHASREPSRQ